MILLLLCLAMYEEERLIGIRMTLALGMMIFKKKLIKLMKLQKLQKLMKLKRQMQILSKLVLFLFLLVEKELSLPHRMEQIGRKGLLDQRVNSEQSPTVMIP